MTSQADRHGTPTRSTLFLHIHKTAGTSIKHYLGNRWPARDCLLQAHWRCQDDKDVNDFAFVTGHIGFGHTERFRTPPVVITCLREPVARSVSHYYFAQTIQDIDHEAAFRGADVVAYTKQMAELSRRYSIDELLREHPAAAATILGNVQTRALCGQPLHETIAPPVTQELFEKAKENLARCDVILLTERMAESVDVLNRFFGWPLEAKMPVRNAGKAAPRSAIPESTRAMLHEMTAFDRELYRFGVELFEERLRRSATAPVRASALPDATCFTFDQPILGSGWHLRSKRDGAWFAWTDQEASIDLATTRRTDSRLRVHIAHAVTTKVFDGLKVFINGEPVRWWLTLRSDKWLIEADVGGASLSGTPGKIHVAFSLAKTHRPCDVFPHSKVNRDLGIAVKRIELVAPPWLARIFPTKLRNAARELSRRGFASLPRPVARRAS
jgi:hypothetical protein